MTTRARFERWAESSGWNIDRTDEGDYRTMSTDAAWGGWNACAEEAERVYSRECTEWARICEYQKRHGCKVGAQECAKLIREWRANNEAAPNVEFSGAPAALSPAAPLERRVGRQNVTTE